MSMLHAAESNRLGLVAQLAEHWISIPKVAGSIPTVVRLTVQPARCGYTLRVTSKTLYSPEYITSKHIQKYRVYTCPASVLIK